MEKNNGWIVCDDSGLHNLEMLETQHRIKMTLYDKVKKKWRRGSSNMEYERDVKVL